MSNVNGESDVSPTESKTTRTDGSFSRGNWEIPETSLSLEMDRSGKARCHHPDMHVAGKSDSLVVPAKQANKAGPQTAAESVEERRLTEESGKQLILVRTQSRDFQSHGLFGVRATTQRDRGDLIPMRSDSSISKVGAVCGSSARTDLCGGRPVMAVPTAISERIKKNLKSTKKLRITSSPRCLSPFFTLRSTINDVQTAHHQACPLEAGPYSHVERVQSS